VIFGAALIGAALVVVQTPPIADGLYGDVRQSRQTGDLNGYEIRLFHEGGKAKAELVVCEGWCNEVSRAQVKPDGSAWIVGFDETLRGYGGAPDEVLHNRLRLVAAHGSLVLSHVVNGKLASHGVRLKPQRKLFGLQIARDTMTACARDRNCASR
jgi:hypothetical protein